MTSGRQPDGLRRRRWWRSGMAAVSVAVVLMAAALLLMARSPEPETPAALASTPVPSSGPSQAGAILVDAASVDLGHIPLDTVVSHAYRLQNVGPEQITITGAETRVLEGCCPSDPTVGATTLAPGAETTVGISMIMHPGMDGAHLFQLTVSTNSAAGARDSLDLYVRAHFG